MSEINREEWPAFLEEAAQKGGPGPIRLAVEPERKLCEHCDYLFFSEGKLHYYSALLGAMCFDLKELYDYHRRQHYALTKEPLARALGIKGGEKKAIWDATCGTGKDALLMHFFGGQVRAFERHPLIFLLLQDAQRRFPLEGLELEFGDAHKKDHGDLARPEVIYYDPMYPEKKKSALPRKEMRIFKEVVGEDTDSLEFLEWALRVARERVVIKRPLAEGPLASERAPTASYKGKSTRYDMYKIF